MQADHVEPPVLPALEQRRPRRARRRPSRRCGAVDARGTVDRPGSTGSGRSVATIRKRPSREPRSREPVGIRRRTPSRDPGRERLPERQPRGPVEEVVVAVVGALAHLDRPVLADHDVGLSGPPRATPPGGIDPDERRRAEAGRRRPPPDHRIERDRPLAVVAARRVAAERREPLERRVDRLGARRRLRVAERAPTMLLVLDLGQDEREHQHGHPDHERDESAGRTGNRRVTGAAECCSSTHARWSDGFSAPRSGRNPGSSASRCAQPP